MVALDDAHAAERTERLRARALELGFCGFGVAAAGPADPEGRLSAWLARGYHAGMGWMEDTADRRADLELGLPGARSVVALATSYYRPEVSTEGPIKVARYARGEDYHRWLRRRVRRLRRTLLALDPGCRVYPTVDTSPVLERAWAARAGVAWIGKSTMAIHPRLGTYTFLATMVTDSLLTYDEPIPDRCGSCTACLDACPTNAFPEPGVLDARRCLSYWTLEVPGSLPAGAPPPHGWVAGCDVCQEVCPWNKFARVSDDPKTRPREGFDALSEARLAEPGGTRWLTDLLAGTALERTGADAIARNVRRASEDEDPT